MVGNPGFRKTTPDMVYRRHWSYPELRQGGQGGASLFYHFRWPSGLYRLSCLQPGPLWSKLHTSSASRTHVWMCTSSHVPPQLRSFCSSHHLILRLGADSVPNLGAQLPTPMVTSGSLLPCSFCHTRHLASCTASWGLLCSVFLPF